KKVYNNALWMMSEKIISIFGLLFITSFVAKYVGPNTFGQISLSIAIFQVVQIIAQMGGDNIIFKRISKNEISGIILMRASSLLRGGSFFIISMLVAIYCYLYVPDDAYIYIFAVGVSYFFLSVDIYSIYNNALLKSKINTISNIIGLFFGLSIRYVIAYCEMNPYYLSIPIILTTLVPFFIRKFIFGRALKIIDGYDFVIDSKKIKTYSRYMLLAGTGIVVSSISIALYSRINQFLLGAVDSVSSVGIYSVAVTLGTSWGFISQSLITSFYSRIYSEKNDSVSINLAAKLNRLVFFISLLFIAVIFFGGRYILEMLYGPSYISAYIPMVLLSIGSLLSSLGTVAYRFIVKYSGYYFLSKKMSVMLLISIPLSFFLIKPYGITGAACSTIIIEFISLTFMNYFFCKGIIFNMHKASFLKWW
ncbi:TPA: oligosaccharide flippase family protein, partial [Klebsiella quasipneumoniae subsp. similipneumoniae]|nr:oligosaccharide flippase family protein [Klebsiella quasipneumoniae subsp. similipneumoniae]